MATGRRGSLAWRTSGTPATVTLCSRYYTEIVNLDTAKEAAGNPTQQLTPTAAVVVLIVRCSMHRCVVEATRSRWLCFDAWCIVVLAGFCVCALFSGIMQEQGTYRSVASCQCNKPENCPTALFFANVWLARGGRRPDVGSEPRQQHSLLPKTR